jgi:uncharacterized membrane protein
MLDPVLAEWLNLVLRWAHLVAGIGWIGSSFFFNWLDSALEKPDPPEDELKGQLWMVHSGGFYDVKKKLLKSGVPPVLHWFKWEAMLTFLTGLLLLVVVYYLGGRAMLVDPAVRDLSTPALVGLVLATLLLPYPIYDALWESRVGQRPTLATGLCVAAGIGLAYALTHVLSGRAAFIHFGAVLGTIMVSNVWRRILPAQQQMIDATRAGTAVDWSLGEKAKTRSRHNNYMTFPVLFTMLSNHFPGTWGSSANWIVLLVLAFASGIVKHFMNVSEDARYWFPRGFAVTLVAVGGLYAWQTSALSAAPGSRAVAFGEIHAIVQARCVTCHSKTPTDATWTTAPLGVTFDTPAEIVSRADRILFRVVTTKTMPFANQTGISDAEREAIGAWVVGGAKIE